MNDVDVLVVGGGPVGLASAIEARLAGMTVAVVEPRDGVIDKACGEGLMPGAVPLLGWPMLAIALACQAGRYWVIRSLGEQWNTRVIVVPGAARVRARGLYRVMNHPNYVIVAIEGVALPLVHTAWITAIAFTVLNAVLLLGFRIPTEDKALRELV